MLSQIIYAFGTAIGICQAVRWTAQLGLNEAFTYIFVGFMEHLEHALTMMPSIILTAKLTPPGIESTIMSLSLTIVRVNQFSLRSSIGILVNY